MDKRIIEQWELAFDLDETFTIDISDELEMQLKSLAEMHNMNLEDYLAGRFRNYLERAMTD